MLTVHLFCTLQWNVQPAPKDHPWRSMKGPHGNGNGMVPHMSGTTLDAQTRYAQGTLKILDNWANGKEQEQVNVIVTGGQYASKAYGQHDNKTTNIKAAV